MTTGSKLARATRDAFLPYALPLIGDEEIREVIDSMRSGWLTTGPKTKQFEADFARYVGAAHAIGVNSCTAGLQIALAALGVGSGDEVILPTLTFCSTANVVVQLGARPVLIDVDEDFHVTAQAIEAAITPRTKAVMPVHYAGEPCDVEAIYRVADRHGIAVVEDAAHAAGSAYCGCRIGSDALLAAPTGLCRVAAFSFYATKNMTTGEGGMIVTSDGQLAERMRVLSLHGMSRDAWNRYGKSGSWKYDVVAPGYKANMTDIDASIGIHQLRRLDEFISTRRKYAARFQESFASLPELQIPNEHMERQSTFHLYVIRLRLERLRIDRAEFITELREHNVGSSVHFIPVHLHRYYQERFSYGRGMLPVAERIYDEIISLPLYPAMNDTDVSDVIHAVEKIVIANRK